LIPFKLFIKINEPMPKINGTNIYPERLKEPSYSTPKKKEI